LKNNNIITVDGPSASGKGSLAKALAKELNFILLDSGLLYRAYSYCFDKCQNHSFTKNLFSNLKIDSIDHEMHVFENNADITSILRQENIAKSASQLSSLKETRDNLISFQRDLASNHGLVADGRDMGTVVFPDAATKIFLIADEEVRAKRRYAELLLYNSSITMKSVIKNIKDRDISDKERDLSPLIPAHDAFLIDSSNLDQDEVLDLAIKHYTDCIR
jgi:cytidylate kinase